MKLSMWSSFYHDLQPEEMVLELEKYGYTYSEISDEHSVMLLDRGDAAEIGTAFKKFADEHNVQFPQGHLKLSARICDDEDRAYVKRQLDLFKALGTKYAVLHFDGLDRYGDFDVDTIRARNVEAIRDLIAHIEGTDIVICLENIHAPKPVARTAEQLLWFMEEIGGEHIGICLDTGHLNLVPEASDQAHFIRTAGKYLKALHLADNDGSGDQHLMPSALGQIDFEAVFRETREIGYDSIYNYEVPGERYITLPLRGFKLNYIRELSAYYWEQCE